MNPSIASKCEFVVSAGTVLAVLAVSILGAPPVYANCDSEHDLATGYLYLDEVRQVAGLVGFARRVELEQSANDHASYLALHRTTSHEQVPGRRGFTGVTPTERARQRGYPGNASENVSYGHSDVVASIDGLMAAIYHRFGFLDIERDEVGIAACRREDADAFVFNLGSSGISALCGGGASPSVGANLVGLCSNEKQMLPVHRVDEWRRQVTQRSPDLIIWPPPGQVVGPAFFEEIPDPLPDRSVSGYPVSIQAHPGRFSELELERFSITRGSIEPIEQLRVLDFESDPNGKLSALDVAVFPLRRLDWGESYSVEATVLLDGERRVLAWTFRTADADGELIELDKRLPYHVIEPGVQYAIYAPPPRFRRIADGVSWRYPAGVTLDTRFQDANTLILTVHGKACAPIELRLQDGTHRLDISSASGC